MSLHPGFDLPTRIAMNDKINARHLERAAYAYAMLIFASDGQAKKTWKRREIAKE
jgi:hypothetical protein